MVSAWIEHVKKVAKDKKISYTEALKVASKTYKKQKGKGDEMPHLNLDEDNDALAALSEKSGKQQKKENRLKVKERVKREMEGKVKDEKRYPPRKGVVNVPMNRKPDKTNKTTLSMKGRGMNSMPSQQVSMLTFDSLLPGVDTSFGGYPYKINLI